MSLIRSALILGAVVYMMPADPEKQRQLIASASHTLIWGVTYCDREPEACRQAQVVWTQLVEKAKFGVALASDLASQWSEQSAARQRAAAADRPVSAAAVPRDDLRRLIEQDAKHSLTPADLAIEPATDG
jgi:hypothetical protein